MIHTQAYYIRNGYGLFPIRNKREAKALYEFCLKQISDENFCRFNPQKAEVFKNTIILYHDEFDIPFELSPALKCKCGQSVCEHISYHNFYWYVSEHCGWYWS